MTFNNEEALSSVDGIIKKQKPNCGEQRSFASVGIEKNTF